MAECKYPSCTRVITGACAPPPFLSTRTLPPCLPPGFLQLGTIGDRESKIEERVAALESKLRADAEGEKEAAAERSLKSLNQLLHQTTVVRRMLRAGSETVAAAGGGEAAAEEDEACWAGTEAREGVGEGRSQGIGEGQAEEGELLLKARARYIRVASHTPETTPPSAYPSNVQDLVTAQPSQVEHRHRL